MKNINKTNKILHFPNRERWRSWLEKNHDKSNGIWMAYYKKHTGKASVPYEDAVEEALCFGWIDSTVRRLDEEKYIQKFTPRKDKSVWSESNKRRVQKMIKEGKMTESGLRKINEARRNGYWDRLTEVNNADSVPVDFNNALQTNKKADEYFKSLSQSNKKLYLWWIISAKREDTRSKRIKEAIINLSQGKKLGMK